MSTIVHHYDTKWIEGETSSPSQVELFVGHTSVAVVQTTPQDGKHRFRLANPVGAMVRDASLTVRVQGEWMHADVSEQVWGYLPKALDMSATLQKYCSIMPDYPEVPQALLNYVGSGEAGQHGYRMIGFTYLFHALSLLGIPASTRVLDIGAGAGRIGFAFGPYLKLGGGHYHGYDTWNDGIEWARENISSIFPEVTFNLLPSPPQGRREGYLAEYSAEIPVDENSFDLALCTSLFTHLRRPAYTAYFRHIHRSLKPNAVALITAKLVDQREYGWIKEFKANAADDYGVYVMDDTYADSYLLEQPFFEDIREAGLAVCRYAPGVWRKELGVPTVDDTRFLCNQDILILKKA